MDGSLKNKCDLFAENYSTIKKAFTWDNSSSFRLGALLYTIEGREADTDAIKNGKELIKKDTGVFSEFKDITFFMTSVILSLQKEPEKLLQRTLSIYDNMKKEGFHSSPYLVLASLSIAMQNDILDENQIIISAKIYYDAMKKEHYFLTSSDDYGFATLLAMTDKSVQQATAEMEECYHILKETFHYSNAVQSLSHVLTFSNEDIKVKCDRVVELHKALKQRKCKFGSGMELCFLGLIALFDNNSEILADKIAEVNEYLKSKKGFTSWSITLQERLMYAAALVCEEYLDSGKKGTMELTLANNMANILLAQQMAIIAATSAATTAAAVSASH